MKKGAARSRKMEAGKETLSRGVRLARGMARVGSLLLSRGVLLVVAPVLVSSIALGALSMTWAPGQAPQASPNVGNVAMPWTVQGDRALLSTALREVVAYGINTHSIFTAAAFGQMGGINAVPHFVGFAGRGVDGTQVSQVGDVLAIFRGQGSGVQHQSSGAPVSRGMGQMQVRATETFSSNNGGGTALDFVTTPNGSGNWTPRMTVDHNGNVGIGTTTPVTTLNVVGAVGASQYCDLAGNNCFTAAQVGTGGGGTTTVNTTTAVTLDTLPAGSTAGYCVMPYYNSVTTVVAPAVNLGNGVGCGCQSGWTLIQTGASYAIGVDSPYLNPQGDRYYSCIKG